MHLKLVEKIIHESHQVLKGKQQQVKLVLCNILSGGHTLIEDAPGVGKTTLAKYIGKSLGYKISRIQFTNDLLPADILGTPIFNRENNSFDFHPGPIFGELILADELNRAPPKTQSALLQAMEEKMVSIEGETFQLPDHFTVIATQNPNVQIGTFSLPESQLDRFSMKIKMGYPDKESTLELLQSVNSEMNLENVLPILNQNIIKEIQAIIHSCHIEEQIYELVYNLLNTSRTNGELVPLSNRCGIDIISLAKSWAYLSGREFVIPDDIFTIFPYTAGHRLVHPENSDIEIEHKTAQTILDTI